jgi:hypothetical protein
MSKFLSLFYISSNSWVWDEAYLKWLRFGLDLTAKVGFWNKAYFLLRFSLDLRRIGWLVRNLPQGLRLGLEWRPTGWVWKD